MKLEDLKSQLQIAQTEYAQRAKDYNAARKDFDAEAAKLRAMREKRASLADLVKRANDESETQRARVRDETAAYLSGTGGANDLGAASRAQQAAQTQAADLALALNAADAPIEAQRRRVADAGKRLLDAHALALASFAGCEGITAAMATFPALMRAQRIATQCDSAHPGALLVKHLNLPRDPSSEGYAADMRDDALRDGRPSRNAIENEIDRLTATEESE
jgi:hypothetical protein